MNKLYMCTGKNGYANYCIIIGHMQVKIYNQRGLFKHFKVWRIKIGVNPHPGNILILANPGL
ncbi:MAG: hypothetical protein D6768_03245 [Chloroflexi bacterium]|nr:MAG: hypothetical protein D6768_03245 [Chloroflexota bacterium]